MYAEIEIVFQCQVSQSRYKIIDGEEPNNRWIVANNPRAPVTPSNLPFNAETLARYLKIAEDKNHAEEMALDFVNTYGMLWPSTNYRIQEIVAWSTYLRLKDIARASGEPIKKWNKVDLNEKLEFEVWEEGKVLPTYRPTSLGEALYLAWFFGWQTTPLKKCKFFAKYGHRTGCHNFFTSKRKDKMFCSDNCRTQYKQRGDKKKK